MEHRVKDLSLAKKGKLQIDWAESRMPVLMKIREEFEKKKPFKGITIGCCLHVTKETAVLVKTLKAGGAKVGLYSSNPLSTKDEIAKALKEEIEVHAKYGESLEEYREYLNKILDMKPQICIDDGGDLITTIHREKTDLIKDVIGGTEETTTGVNRFRNMAKKRFLNFPVIAVNDAKTKYLFDNRYGTGQSTIDGILRATNVLLTGKTFVVCGYGWCGRGIAMRAKGMGANVVITEVSPLRALEAHMDGYKVLPIDDAAKIGDIFVTSTGDTDVITLDHIKEMKNGTILANAGHFNVEVAVEELEKKASRKRDIRKNLVEYEINGKKVYLIAEGRLVNLVAAEGHPSEVMDMSFANQALCVQYLVENREQLKPRVYEVPAEIDERVAKLKLMVIGIKIDSLTSKQRKYLESWKAGAFEVRK